MSSRTGATDLPSVAGATDLPSLAGVASSPWFSLFSRFSLAGLIPLFSVGLFFGAEFSLGAETAASADKSRKAAILSKGAQREVQKEAQKKVQEERLDQSESPTKTEKKVELIFPQGRSRELALVWRTEQPSVQFVKKDDWAELSVVLELSQWNRQYSLIYNNRPLAANAEGKIRVEVPLKGISTQVKLVGVNLVGELSMETIGVFFPAYESTFKELASVSPQRHFPQVGLGLTSNSYASTLVSDVAQTAVTLKASWSYLLVPPRWDLGVSGYLTALALMKSRSEAATFLGLNLRMGYLLPPFRSPWRGSLYGGFYYTTMFVKDDAFGYRNIIGPQIYPSVKRLFSNGNHLAGYLKFSPVASNFQLLSLSNREIAFGFSYSWLLERGRTLSITLDWAQLALLLDTNRVQSDSLTLGASLSL